MRLVVPVLAPLTLVGCGSLNYYGDKGPPGGGGTVSTQSTPSTPSSGDDDTVDSGSPNTDPSSSSGTVHFQPAVTSVTPSFGSNLGGETITVEGSFDHSTRILVDGVGATITSQNSIEITAIVPSTNATGWVDVEADNGADSVRLKDGFQYWQDGTGLAGTFGWLSFVHEVGGYWLYPPTDLATGALGFIEPDDWELWQDYAPSMDSCAFNYAETTHTLYDPGASEVDLSSSAATLALQSTPPAGAYGNSNLSATQVTPGTVYDLDPVTGNADWPGFGIKKVVKVPGTFTVSTPAMNKSIPPTVPQSISLSWGGSPGDYVLVFILRQTEYYYADDGVVTCAVADDGSFTIPANVWPTWTAGEFLHVEVGRVLESSTILPHNNAENRMPGIYWYYGGAIAN